MKPLRVGFLVDGLEVSSHVMDLIRHVAETDNFCDPVIIHGHCAERRVGEAAKHEGLPAAYPGRGLLGTVNRLSSEVLYKLIRKTELRGTLSLYPDYDKTHDIRALPSYEEVVVRGQWSKTGLYLSFPHDDIEKLGNANLDCIVRCGSGVLKGKILNLPKHGVLSFHYGDNRVYRGSLGGFWEVLNNHPTTGFVIQRLNEEIGGGGVLVRGNLMTQAVWTLNHAALLQKANWFFKNLLDRLAKTGSLPPAERPRLHGQTLLRMNGAGTLLLYLYRTLPPRILSKLTGILSTHRVGRWSIAYAEHDGFSKSLWRYKEVENPRGRFLADPFILERSGRQVIFVEDLFYSDGKGRISAVELKDDGEEFLGVVLEEDFHLSFPFVFELDGEVYMIPETGAARQIRLYKCVEFPRKWQLAKVLMSNVSAADTMIVRRNEMWFMLTNICSAGLEDHQSELHIFHSDRFDSSEWKPIESGNPVIFDSRSARNGGFFYHDDELYRINQIHGKSHYGKAFGVNRVLTLNECCYVEERVSTIGASFKEGICSTHHFNANSRIAVVDYCRMQRLGRAEFD